MTGTATLYEESAREERGTPEKGAWFEVVEPNADMRHAIRYALNAIDEYLMGARIDWHDVRDVLKRAIGEKPKQYSKEGVEDMEWQSELVKCEICALAGEVSPATKWVLGHDVCDQCAIEMEASLRIGPAIWIVEVDADEVYEGYSEADWGTVDFGPYTLGWRDREAAEAYARRAGTEAREGFLVKVAAGGESQALDAAGVEWVVFDTVFGAFWPHDDAEGLRERLLYGAEA